jgi:hypothetical protein
MCFEHLLGAQHYARGWVVVVELNSSCAICWILNVSVYREEVKSKESSRLKCISNKRLKLRKIYCDSIIYLLISLSLSFVIYKVEILILLVVWSNSLWLKNW